MKIITEGKSLDQLFEDYSLEKSSIEKKLKKGVPDKEEAELKKRLQELKVRLIPRVMSRIQDKRKVEN